MSYLTYINCMFFCMIQDGYTALMYASENSNIDIVKLLLQAGADINIQNKVRNSSVCVCTACNNNNNNIYIVFIACTIDIVF